MPCLGLGWYGPKEEDILIVDGSGGEPVAQGVLPDADKMCASRCVRQVCRAASLQRMLPLARPTLAGGASTRIYAAGRVHTSNLPSRRQAV